MMMLDQKVTEFIDVLSSAAPVPGGGGASATVGAFASALGMMVANLTIGKKKFQNVEAELIQVREDLHVLQQKLVRLADEDAKAFEPLSKAYSLPKTTPEEIAEKERIMETCLYGASIVPLETMETIFEVMKLLKILGEKGSKMAVSDVGTGISFARSALETAAFNVYINTKSMKDRTTAAQLNKKADKLIHEAKILEEVVFADVMRKIRG